MEARIFKEQRKKLLFNTEGKVLEIGVGTGKNLPFYPHEVELVGIDFSPGMLNKAKYRAQQLKKPVTLLEMDVQSLDFPDNTFDSVVATCVFCSVPDPVAGLREIKRVCKPNGTIFMLEHVRSEGFLLGKVMDFLNFIPLFLYGANINRETVNSIKNAGFSDLEVTDVWYDILKKICYRNNK